MNSASVGRFAGLAGRQVVGDVDLPSLGQQRVGEVAADEAGAAGDQRAAAHPAPRNSAADSVNRLRSSANAISVPSRAVHRQ